MPLSAPAQKVSWTPRIARAFGDEFAVRLIVGLGFLEGCDHRSGVLSHLRFQRLLPVLHGLQGGQLKVSVSSTQATSFG
jgi:hypothetical protein